MPQGHFSDNEEISYTPQDIRFTAKGSKVYAMIMRWPENGKTVIRSMARQSGQTTMDFHGLIKEVFILGVEKERLNWHQEEDGLHVECAVLREMPVVAGVEVF